MSLRAYPVLLEKLKDSEYRNAFVSASVRSSIALQIRALRKAFFGPQEALGKAADKPANVISRLENPDYGNFTVRTLLDLAKAFNVALIVKFGTFGELAAQVADLSDETLMVPSFQQELAEDSFAQLFTRSILADLSKKSYEEGSQIKRSAAKPKRKSNH